MQTQNSASFSVVVPLFNEEENVLQLVDKIFGAVGSDPRFLEMILVDDGSLDATASLASNLVCTDERIRLVRHDSNKGLGAAICTGLNAADGELVLYTDADLPFDFSLIPELLSKADDRRVVAGYRLNRGEGPRRWALTKGYNLLIWLFFGLYQHDVNFACKIFPRKFLNSAELSSAGSFIDVEMLLETRRLGLKVEEYPLVYYPRERGLSTLSRPIVILNILKEMFRYMSRRLSYGSASLELINASPIAKLAVFLITLFTSAALILRGFRFEQGTAWLALAVEACIASVIFGWRVGLSAALLPFVGVECLRLWQGQSFWGPENYNRVAWALIGIPLSQLAFGCWKLIQRSFKLSPSE